MQPDALLGPYRLLARLGAGGMGEVWKAEDTRLGRLVAIKILPAAVAGDAEALARMKREARTAAQLNHPNIATIYAIEEHGERLFIVMELVDGEPLSQVIARGPMSEGELVRVARSVADALAEAHAKGIVHRDVKPDNILVSGTRVKVLDFGIAKQVGVQTAAQNDPTAFVTQQGVIIGTVQYMSPEQALGKPLDARTDLFSLGIVMYQAATGKLPFSGETVTETITQIVRDEPEDPSRVNPRVTPRMASIIRRCLEKKREARFADAGELVAALDAAAPTQPQTVMQPATVIETAPRTQASLPQAQTAPQPRKPVFGAATIVIVLLVLAVGVGAWAMRQRQHAVQAKLLNATRVAETTTTTTTTTTAPPPATASAPEGKPVIVEATKLEPAAAAPTVAAPASTTQRTPQPQVQPQPKSQPQPVPQPAPPPAAAPQNELDIAYANAVRELATGRHGIAAEMFRAIVKTDHHYAAAHFRLGEIFLGGHKFLVAREEFDRALRDPDRLDARERELAEIGVAITSGDSDAARARVESFAIAHPNDPDLAAWQRALSDNPWPHRRLRR